MAMKRRRRAELCPAIARCTPTRCTPGPTRNTPGPTRCFVIVWFPILHHALDLRALVPRDVAHFVREVQEGLLSEAAEVLRELGASSNELLLCFALLSVNPPSLASIVVVWWLSWR